MSKKSANLKLIIVKNRIRSNLARNRKCTVFLLLVSCLQLQCGAINDSGSAENAWEAGEVYEDQNGWLEARAGNMPLVISAPHGGVISPEEIPDRICEGATTVRDRNTTELAFELEKELMEQHDMQPFVIAAHISRKKIDLNRDMEESTCGNDAMEDTWHQYHEYIEGALSAAIDQFGYALYIDLHGHGHDKQRLELGYLLSKSELRDNYYDSETTVTISEKSSLKNLLAIHDELNLRELLTGENAFGSLIDDEGFPAVPGFDDPFPLADDPYFTGGYNTRRYTSADYPNVFGWQIEANYDGLRESDEGRKKFAGAFAKSVTAYMDQHIKL